MLTLDEQGGLTRILANGVPVVSIADEDAVLEAVDRRILAEAYRLRIAEAITSYRAARQPALLWRHAGLAVAATFGVLLAGFVSHRLRRRLRRFVERHYAGRVHDLSIQSLQVVKAEHMWRLIQGTLTLLWGIVAVLLLYTYLRYTLSLFPWTRGIANRLVSIATDPLQLLVQGFLTQIPNLVFLAILALVTRFVLKLVRLFFDAVGHGTVTLPNFDTDWAMPTYKLTRILIVALALVVAYPYIPGSDTEAFKGISLFVGRDFLPRILIAHRQPDCGLQHDLPPRVQGGRSRQDRRARRRGHCRCGCSRRICAPRRTRRSSSRTRRLSARGRELHDDGARQRADPAHDGRASATRRPGGRSRRC